jgi:signal transduction histidine kinase
MLRLVSDLLDASLCEVGRLSVFPRRCPVDELMRPIADLLEPLAREKNVRLLIDQRQPLTILADPERMIQVLCNLITNGIKFTPPNGVVAVDSELQGEYVRFSVRDTGNGISPQELPHLCEPYWRSPHVRHRGAGLGLYIASDIVAAHGGSLWVESEVGRGTNFYFTVPAAD